MIRTEPLTYIFAALLLLTLPLNWLAAALCAAFFHEFCHVLVLLLQGNPPGAVRIGPGGAEIEAAFESRRQELLCALAGPMGSLLLILLHRQFPRLALCGAVQGLFNLLPIYPLDGGRILSCILAIFLPGSEEKLLRQLQGIVCVLLAALAVAGSIVFSMGIWPLALSILLILKAFLRKIPCKRRQIRVQ